VHWLPVYWHEHLVASGRESEAAELLSFADAIALPATATETGWNEAETFDEGVLRLAVRHVRYRAAVYAAVIRAGRLPTDHFDYSFEPLREERVRTPDFTGLPRAVKGVWDQLVVNPPKSFSRRP
jgi:hypothetical protein